MEITHFSHRHSLALSEETQDEICCSACRLPISGPAYVCANCKYFIHKSCGELPQQIDHLFFHPLHPLTLAKAPFRSRQLCCDTCGDICSGFVFRCSECDFNLDIVCASLKPYTLEEENYGQYIEYFSHQHPLIHVTCDEEKNKIKCFGCEQPIKGSIYVCFGCKFFIHKSCAELPQQIRHPFHRSHDLTLVAKQLYKCHACNKTSSGLTYHCSACSFDLDIVCSRLKEPITHEGNQEKQIRHSFHEHPLTPVPCVKGIYKMACCACGKDVENTDGCIYVCFDCKFFIHEACVELPLEIQHYPFHPQHSLALCYQSINIQGRRECGFCQEFSPGAVIFQCSSCNYFVDVPCAMLMPSISEEQFEKRMDHHCHQHPLFPFDWKTTPYMCSGCRGYKEGSGYTCPECYFVICHSCAKLPQEIEQHPFHPQHTLISKPSNPWGDRFCIVCGEHGCGFLLHCFECSLAIGLRCATRRIVQYEGHEHPLVFLDLESDSTGFYNPLKCHSCGALCRRFFLRCVLCDLNIHVKCIPQLPRTVKVDTHRHRLTLTDPLPEDGSDEYYCDHCEKERNPKHCVYYCAECNLAAHIECGIAKVVISSWEEEEESLAFQQLVDAGVDVFQCFSCEEEKHDQEISPVTEEIEDVAKNIDATADDVAGVRIEEEKIGIPNFDPHSNQIKALTENLKRWQRARARREAHSRISTRAGRRRA